MFNQNVVAGASAILVAGFLAGGMLVPVAGAQTAAASERVEMTGAPMRYRQNRPSKRAGIYYGVVWGVDSLSAKTVESGEIVRFSYRVLDADKAKTLNDKKNEPSLIDPQAGVKLVVPAMPFVGQMRQSNAPEVGKSYWVAFSNKGRRVKRGDRVIVTIGQFRADGLMVE